MERLTTRAARELLAPRVHARPQRCDPRHWQKWPARSLPGEGLRCGHGPGPCNPTAPVVGHGTLMAWISAALSGGRPAAAGNEVGIAGAHVSAPVLFPAHLCAGSTCGKTKVPWWRGCGCIPGGQGVAGSNPAVPTGNRLFSNIFSLRKSQQKSQLVVQWPFQRPAPRVSQRPTRAWAKTAEQAS